MPTYKDISTSLLIHPLLKELPEYPDPDRSEVQREYAPPPGSIVRAFGLEDPFVDDPDLDPHTYINANDSTVSVYVPKLLSQNDQFWIHFEAEKPEIGKGWLLKVLLHDQPIVSLGVGSVDGFRGSITFCRRLQEDGTTVWSNFRFTDELVRRIDHGEDPYVGTSPISIDSAAGNMFVAGVAPLTIQIYRYKANRRIDEDTSSSHMPMDVASSSIHLSPTRPLYGGRPSFFYEYGLVDSLHTPFATFKYFVNTPEQLEALGIDLKEPIDRAQSQSPAQRNESAQSTAAASHTSADSPQILPEDRQPLLGHHVNLTSPNLSAYYGQRSDDGSSNTAGPSSSTASPPIERVPHDFIGDRSPVLRPQSFHSWAASLSPTGASESEINIDAEQSPASPRVLVLNAITTEDSPAESDTTVRAARYLSPISEGSEPAPIASPSAESIAYSTDSGASPVHGPSAASLPFPVRVDFGWPLPSGVLVFPPPPGHAAPAAPLLGRRGSKFREEGLRSPGLVLGRVLGRGRGEGEEEGDGEGDGEEDEGPGGSGMLGMLRRKGSKLLGKGRK